MPHRYRPLVRGPVVHTDACERQGCHVTRERLAHRGSRDAGPAALLVRRAAAGVAGRLPGGAAVPRCRRRTDVAIGKGTLLCALEIAAQRTRQSSTQMNTLERHPLAARYPEYATAIRRLVRSMPSRLAFSRNIRSWTSRGRFTDGWQPIRCDREAQAVTSSRSAVRNRGHEGRKQLRRVFRREQRSASDEQGATLCRLPRPARRKEFLALTTRRSCRCARSHRA